MKICESCRVTYACDAYYCMTCGKPLVQAFEEPVERHRKGRGWNLFWISLCVSLMLSWVLIAVFHLPVFILGAILPLFWWASQSDK